MLRKSVLVVVAAVLLGACGASSQPTGVATNPVVSGQGTVGATPTAAASGIRTVLTPLGINIHASAALGAAVLGTAAQGVTLTVVDHSDQSGGWYKVQGMTVTGWIVADPALTADGQYTSYQSTARNFSALIPQTWTFAEEPADVLFHPMTGVQTLLVRNGARLADFGPSGATGYIRINTQAVVVCGVTGTLNLYSHTGSPPPAPAAGASGPLALLAQIRLTLDPTHALAMDFNYTVAADLSIFGAFYNSVTFPFPQCEAPPPAPT